MLCKALDREKDRQKEITVLMKPSKFCWYSVKLHLFRTRNSYQDSLISYGDIKNMMLITYPLATMLKNRTQQFTNTFLSWYLIWEQI